MENLNAEQVKKALECCTRSGCSDNETKDCPLKPYEDCATRLATTALALINSQEQRIKILDNKSEYRLGYEQGVKDMAQRLCTYYTTLPLPKVQPTVVEYNIRVLAEELLEEGE